MHLSNGPPHRSAAAAWARCTVRVICGSAARSRSSAARVASRDPERLARLEREARALAAVSHANIAALCGNEDAGGTSYLELEMVEGASLAERLARGALGVGQDDRDLRAKFLGGRRGDEQGINHRDLKPGSVMVSKSGAVKVLDFELTLVCPLEAPMIYRTRFGLFREVRIASGTPEGSDVLSIE